MSGVIKILDEKVSNMIAAGEVVENPASMIKELLENSIDAGSTYINIAIKNGNRYVKIADNGKGMSRDDVLLSVERHATSKIETKEDLSKILTYGFRGEALSSISSVSKMSISSKTENEEEGTLISINGGKITNFKGVQRERGTEIEVRELFFNTPARLKFLRKEATETRAIKDIVTQEALTNPNVSIVLSFNGNESIRTSGRGMKNTILELFGKNVLQNTVSFPLGFLGNTSLNRSNKDGIFTFINNRPVKSKIIEDALIDGYYTKLMKGRYPFAILFVEIDPQEVDVNVHPSKKVVKFSDEKKIYEYVYQAVKDKLSGDEEFVSPIMPVFDKEKNDSFLDVSDFIIPKKENKTFKDEVIETEPMSFDIDFEDKKEERIANSNEVVGSRFDKNIEENKIEVENKFIGEENSQDKINVAESTGFEVNDSYENIENSERNDNFNFETVDKNEKKSKKVFSNDQKTDKLNSMVYNSQGLREDNQEPLNKENEVNPINTNKKKKNYRVIGQFSNSYILVERNGILEIYDQHVVHERILYEKFRKEYHNKSISVQNLLVPVKITVSNRDREIVETHGEELKKFGFEIDFFGKNDILVRAIPNLNFSSSIENLVRELIEDLKSTNIRNNLLEEIIIMASCKNAIKANQAFSNEELELLLDKFYEINEFTCPHGRPIILKLTTSDIEKSFKRK